MSGAHTDIPPELRRLAQAILNGIDPAVRAAATMASTGGAGKCQQVWCPVCALAAVVNGEQHPLMTVIASHSVALLDVLRALLADMVDDIERATAQASPDAPADDVPVSGPPVGTNGNVGATDNADANGNGTGKAKTRYQPITITLQD